MLPGLIVFWICAHLCVLLKLFNFQANKLMLCYVMYAGFWKRGGQKFQKIWEEQRSESEVVPLKFSLIFRPNLGEEHKKKRSSLKFRPIFRPNLGEEQKKKKKRSLLKVRPVFHPNSLKFPAKSLKAWCPTYKGGGHASILLTLLCNFAILATQRGGPRPNGPPLNTPLATCLHRLRKNFLGGTGLC